MADAVEELRGLEVLARATGVDIAAGVEAILFEEHERQPPFAFVDELAAATAMCAARRRALGAVQARHAPMLDAEAGRGGQRIELRVRRCCGLGFEERLRSRVGAAGQVEPQRHLAVAERVRLALAEPQLALGDRLVAAATFGAAARRGFDDVGQRRDYRGAVGLGSPLAARRSVRLPEPRILGPDVSASSAAGASQHATTTAFSVLAAISFCHLLNDMMQSLLPAMYPILKENYGLTFGQIGILTFTFQVTASLLQPVIGVFTDKRPQPYSLPSGMGVHVLRAVAACRGPHSYPVLLAAAALVGMGSAVLHPESSRVARMAAGGRPGLAQSLFQMGGNIGSSIGPLFAAVVVLRFGQAQRRLVRVGGGSRR